MSDDSLIVKEATASNLTKLACAWPELLLLHSPLTGRSCFTLCIALRLRSEVFLVTPWQVFPPLLACKIIALSIGSTPSISSFAIGFVSFNTKSGVAGIDSTSKSGKTLACAGRY